MGIASKVNSWIAFFKSVTKEVKYLKLPTKGETLVYLIIVLIMALICSMLFFVMDKLAYKIITKILLYFA